MLLTWADMLTTGESNQHYTLPEGSRQMFAWTFHHIQETSAICAISKSTQPAFRFYTAHLILLSLPKIF